MPLQLDILLRQSTRAHELLCLHQQYGAAFDPSLLAECWRSLGRVSSADRRWLQSDGGALLFALREQTSRHAFALQARGLARTAHALATLAITGPAWGRFWEELEAVALACVHDFSPQGLANLAWACATTGRAAPALGLTSG